MAQIEIERKPRRSVWPLLLALLVIGVIAVGVWFFVIGRGAADVDDTPGAAIPEETGVGVGGGADPNGIAPVLLLPAAGGETMYEA